MAADFIKYSIERLIRNMMNTKDRHISTFEKNLMGILSDSEIEFHEIERIINNYEAICGNYIKQSRKKMIKSLGYLNNRLYSSMKSELSNINKRIERLAEKIEQIERSI